MRVVVVEIRGGGDDAVGVSPAHCHNTHASLVVVVVAVVVVVEVVVVAVIVLMVE